MQYLDTLLKQLQVSSKATVEERSKAEALFASLGEGAIVTDEHGKISRVNQVALDLLDFEDKDLVGQWYPQMIVAEDENGVPIPNMERPITQAIISGNPITKKIYFRKKDGSRLPVVATVAPVMLKDKPIGAIEVFRDITRDVELETAKNEFISIASHQLRTPATGVKQYIGMMLQGYAGKLTSEQEKMLKTAYESNERQLIIINELLRAAKADANNIKVEKDRVDLIALIADVIREQQSSFDMSKQKLQFEAAGQEIWCMIDPLQFRMVIENIISNAHKYTKNGKKITVTAKETSKYVVVKIEDQGVGISKKDMPKLFQKFSRINNPLSTTAGGNGLGLFWAKKVIDLHDGYIRVKSELDKGTAFTIKLPK